MTDYGSIWAGVAADLEKERDALKARVAKLESLVREATTLVPWAQEVPHLEAIADAWLRDAKAALDSGSEGQR